MTHKPKGPYEAYLFCELEKRKIANIVAPMEVKRGSTINLAGTHYRVLSKDGWPPSRLVVRPVSDDEPVSASPIFIDRYEMIAPKPRNEPTFFLG